MTPPVNKPRDSRAAQKIHPMTDTGESFWEKTTT